MPRAIAYDLTRLFLGPLSQSPRGIDRVDIAFANYLFFNRKIESVGILPTPWGIRAFNADMVRRGLDHLHHIWAERIDEGEDPHWQGLVAAILEQGVPNRPAPRRKPAGLLTKAQRMWMHLRRTGIALGRSVATLPHGAIYLNIGQIGLAVPVFHRWLANRRDITAAFMLHDTIPLEYPQFVSPSSVTHHARMVQTALERADLVITTTQHARETIVSTMAQMGRADVPIHVRGLPLPAALGMPRSADPALAGRHYFLTCSTIEPRKNHGLLIDVWRRIVARMGARAPHLVIVGSPGRHAETILGEITGDPALARHIHHVSGLSSPALGRLTLGAAAMLCPSYAEGFGLSVLEANALGVPTIASDIASHREIANAQTRLLPPDDRHAWEEAIMDLPPGFLRSTPAIPETMTEAAYCRDIAAFLHNFAQTKHKDAMQDFSLRHEKRQ